MGESWARCLFWNLPRYNFWPSLYFSLNCVLNNSTITLTFVSIHWAPLCAKQRSKHFLGIYWFNPPQILGVGNYYSHFRNEKTEELRVLVTHPWLHGYVIGLGFEPQHSSSTVRTHPPATMLSLEYSEYFREYGSFLCRAHCTTETGTCQFGERGACARQGWTAEGDVPSRWSQARQQGSRELPSGWSLCLLAASPPPLSSFCFVRERNGPGIVWGT